MHERPPTEGQLAARFLRLLESTNGSVDRSRIAVTASTLTTKSYEDTHRADRRGCLVGSCESQGGVASTGSVLGTENVPLGEDGGAAGYSAGSVLALDCSEAVAVHGNCDPRTQDLG